MCIVAAVMATAAIATVPMITMVVSPNERCDLELIWWFGV
jgi:hypothetical protein